jgi:type II secretory pathway pseudopilin PulG
MKRPPHPLARPGNSFSLIEVVLALAIVSFAIIAILGLFSAGLKANKESYDQIQEANIASLLIATRRSAPDNTLSNFSSFGLPNLDQNYITGTNRVGIDGMIASDTNSSITNTVFNVAYGVGTNSVTGPKVANIYILVWPSGAAAPQTNNPGSYYEIYTQVALP